MTNVNLYDHYKKRAAECRSLAGRMRTTAVKKVWTDMAATYEQLAEGQRLIDEAQCKIKREK